QKAGICVEALFARHVELRDRVNAAACFGYPPDHTTSRASEDNYAFGVPGTTQNRIWRIAQSLRGSSRDADFLEFSCASEGDETAVGRPEWIAGILCSLDGPRLHRVHVADPKNVASIGTRCGEGHVTAVGRNAPRSSDKPGLIRCWNYEANCVSGRDVLP